MKKILGLIAAGVLSFGAFGGVSMAADCTAPVSIDCDKDEDTHCTLYVSIAEAGVELCENPA